MDQPPSTRTSVTVFSFRVAMTRFGRAATRTTIRVSEAASQGSQLKSPKICYVYIYVHISVHYMVYVYMYRYCIYIYIWELKFYKTCWTLSFLLQGLQMVMQHGSLRSPKSTMPSLASKSACWSWNWRNPQRIVSFFWSQWNIYICIYIIIYPIRYPHDILSRPHIFMPYFHCCLHILMTFQHQTMVSTGILFFFFWLKHSNRKHHICMSFPRFSIIFLLVKAPILPKRWFQVASVAPKWSDTADRWFYPAWAPRARRNCCEEPFLWGKDVGKPGGFSLIFWGF
jgi:hypothetical protein